MANNKSAQKRIEINKRNRRENKFYKTSVQNLTKLYLKNIELFKISQNLTDKNNAKNILNSIYSFIDKATKKKIFHKNTAARKKSYLAALLKTI